MLPSTNIIIRPRLLLHHGYQSRMRSKLVSPTLKPGEASKINRGDATPEEIERYLFMADAGRLGSDPWSGRLALLDLHVPTPLSSLPKDSNLREKLRFLQRGLENRISNAMTMFRIARNHSLPWNPIAQPYSLQIFQTSSTKPNTWLEPLRDISLDSYKQINTALAANDLNTIRSLTDGAYMKRVMATMKVLHATPSAKSPASSRKTLPRTRHVWHLHSLASPVRCVSIRAQQAHFGRVEPLFGTRWVVQACIKFDTWQSLSTFSPSSSSVQEPKRVLEYLVFEKKMWHDEPWAVRDQLWEGLLANSMS